ncbi:MAG: tetratricopeptide repeat protein [Candidatus Omnitrophica bacterium]|nr:tetratricopeptide repeat protein [Candidatus Omnitrophota bacterium]
MNALLKKIILIGISIVLSGTCVPGYSKEPQNQKNEFKENFAFKARELIKEGKTTEAEKILKDAIAGMPQGWRPIHDLPGRITIVCWNEEEFLAYARYNEKLRQPKKIIWMEGPSYSQTLYLLGFIAVEKKNFKDAIIYFDNAIALEPDHPTLLCEKAFTLRTMGHNEEAYNLYMKALDIRPWALPHQRAVALRGAGFALTELNRLAEAETLYKKSLELEPGNDIALHELEYIKHLKSGGSAYGTKTVVTEPAINNK